MADTPTQDLTELTVELLSAFVANNSVRSDDLPSLIASTYAALFGLNAPEQGAPRRAEHYRRAVTARKSLANPDFILSLIDGKPHKTLKRHLTGHGLTPTTYRLRYGLPLSYPMVAPGYSDARREIATRLGLGRKPKIKSAADAAKPVREQRTAKQPAR